LGEGFVRQRILDDQPGQGEPAGVLDFHGHRRAFADFKYFAGAAPAGHQFVRPRAGEKPAQPQNAQQHIHRVHEQVELEHQPQQQQRERAQDPFHEAKPEAGVGGTGTVFSTSSSTVRTVFLRNRLSGRRISRWPSTWEVICLTSSGVIKSAP